ncbi:cell wall-associated NlpC family hydrolase [Streptacidiphilus sp. EB129]
MRVPDGARRACEGLPGTDVDAVILKASTRMSLQSRKAVPPAVGGGEAAGRPRRPWAARSAAVGIVALSLLLVPTGAVHADARPLPCPVRLQTPDDSLASVSALWSGAGRTCVADALERVRGQAVAAMALTTLGTPYSWGGGDTHGPTVGFCDQDNGYLDGVCQADHTVGFDCSGLALYSWYQATGGAVSLPHYSVRQRDSGRHLETDELIPGDLLFFAEPGGPIHHVGIYLGGGAMIHAEHTGTVVRVLNDVFHDPFWGPRFVGATRPAP